ncbi:MAG: FadR/GntR family transcriptional regulator [Thermomicrobiales bacterium]
MTSEEGVVEVRGSLANSLAAEMTVRILDGTCLPGSPLPPEPDLCARFEVSRTVVREAMARLARQGLVEIRQGVGTVVRDRAEWRDLDPDLLAIRADAGLLADVMPDLLEIRRMVEIEAAGLAAQRRGDRHLALLRGVVEEEESDGCPEAAEASPGCLDLDGSFHAAVAEASGNAMLRQLLRLVDLGRQSGRGIPGHREILDAIENGDRDAARQAMARHAAHPRRRARAAAP